MHACARARSRFQLLDLRILYCSATISPETQSAEECVQEGRGKRGLGRFGRTEKGQKGSKKINGMYETN